MTIVLNLPMPPSTNRLWRSTKYGTVYKNTPAKSWCEQAAWSVTEQRRGALIDGPCTVLIEVAPIQKRGDIDNRIKACLDVCQQGGAIRDDKHVLSVTALWSEHVRTGVRVTIEAAKISPALQRAFSVSSHKPKRRELCPNCGNAYDLQGRPKCDCPDESLPAIVAKQGRAA